MAPTLQSLGIDRLSIAEKVALVQAIRDSMAVESGPSSVAEAQKTPWEQIEAETVARMVRANDLNPDEIVRLLQVLWDYDPSVQKQELEEELKCILAARELAGKPKLTNDVVDRARMAFTSGNVAFVPQDMD